MLWPLPYFGGYVYGRCHILRIVIAVAIDILSRHAKRRTSLRISEV